MAETERSLLRRAWDLAVGNSRLQKMGVPMDGTPFRNRDLRREASAVFMFGGGTVAGATIMGARVLPALGLAAAGVAAVIILYGQIGSIVEARSYGRKTPPENKGQTSDKGTPGPGP